MTRKYFLTELNKLMGSYLAEHGFKIKQDCTICKTANDFFVKLNCPS
jgi:arylamine N-acetyltransferase